jgi:hypothetical protein
MPSSCPVEVLATAEASSTKVSRTGRRLSVLAMLLLVAMYRCWTRTMTFAMEETSSISKQQQHQQQQVRPSHTPNCWRRCEQRNNVLVYHAPRPAGLNDRTFVMEGLGNLAAYLCARLEFPSPQESLDSIHTMGIPTDPKFDWTTDFVNMTILPDHEPLLVDATTTTTTTTSARRPSPNNHHKNVNVNVNVHHSIQTWLPFWIDQHFRKAEQLSYDETASFVWDIHYLSYYKMIKYYLLPALPTHKAAPDMWPTASSNYGGCRYIQSHVPNHVQELMQQIMEQSILPHTTSRGGDHGDNHTTTTIVGTLHIRRGDGTSKCDTRLERIQSYLECSLAGLSQKKIVILFSSDEIDVDYRKGVQYLVERQHHHAITFLDLDALVRQALAQEPEWRRTNNFYVYRIIRALQESPLVQFSLSQRRNIACHDCDPIQEQLDK